MSKKRIFISALSLWSLLLPSALCFAQDGEGSYTFTGDTTLSGGFFDSIIAGSAVGTLFGHEFTGFGILDMAAAAIALYIMFKLILFYGLSSQDDSHHTLDSSQLPDEDDPKKAIKTQALNAWARLRSESTDEDGGFAQGQRQGQASTPNTRSQSGHSQSTLENFDRDDFLDGAKLLYTRLQKAWAARQIDQLKDFITSDMLDVLNAHAKEHPETTSIDVVLVTPTLIDVVANKTQNNNSAKVQPTRDSGNQEALQAKVLFTALISEGNAQHPVETKEIWYFVYDPSQQTSWQLDGIEPVTNNTI